MTHHFKFYKEYWCSSRGCSCCPDDVWEYYESGDVDPTLGTAHSEEDCYVHAIVTLVGRELIVDDVLYKLYEYSFGQLMDICDRLGIIVEIVEEEDEVEHC